MSYTCPICNKTYTSLDDFIKCLHDCTQAEEKKAIEKKEASTKIEDLRKQIKEKYEELKTLADKFNELSEKQHCGISCMFFDLEEPLKKLNFNIPDCFVPKIENDIKADAKPMEEKSNFKMPNDEEFKDFDDFFLNTILKED